MIPESFKNSQEWLRSWSDVWPLLRKGLNDRILAEVAAGSTHTENAASKLAREQCMAQLIAELDQVGTVQPELNRTGPKPLNPVY